MKKKVAYVGFSYMDGIKHSSATIGGVAQSDFTYEILNEVFDCDYYIAQSENIFDINTGNKKQFRLRKGFWGNLIDATGLVISLKKNGPYEAVIVYHSLLYYFAIILLKILGLKQILQLNEIFYRGKDGCTKIQKTIEILMLKIPKKFIISTNSLRNFIDKDSKIVAIIPGPIYLSKNTQTDCSSNSDTDGQLGIENIKMVYAGIIDKEKNGGAFIAVQLASKLNCGNFKIDIFGFGGENDLKNLHDCIEINNINSLTKVKYCGELQHSELIHRLEDYQIGLSTQYIGTQFSESSFPSKILTYLSAGLNVISAASPAVESWEYSDILFVYKDIGLEDLEEYILAMKIKSKLEISNQILSMRSQISSNISRGI